MATKRKPSEIGSTGLRLVNSTLVQQDQTVSDLKFPNSVKTYRKMESDPIISGVLTMIKQFVRKVDWDIEPYNGLESTPKQKKQAQFIKDSLFRDMNRSFDSLISDIISFVKYGFAFFEPVYKYDDQGRITWKDISARPASTISGFNLNNSGDVTSIKQYRLTYIGESSYDIKNGDPVEIPYDRLLHFRTDAECNNPLGRSILNNAYRAWLFKRELEELEAIGAERYLGGLPKIEIPSDYFAADPVDDPEMYAQLLEFIKMGQNARLNEQACIIIPSDRDENGNKLFDFDLLSSKGGNTLDTSKIIERFDYRIAQSLLGDFLLMGSSSTGSFALSDNKVHTFLKSLEAYLEVISEQFNRLAIPRLYRLNGWNDKEVCRLVHKPVSSATLTELGDFLDKASSFITPDETLENSIRDRADLPRRDIDKLYLSTPTGTAQAISQRIGMTRSTEIEGTDSEGNGLGDKDSRGADLAKSMYLWSVSTKL